MSRRVLVVNADDLGRDPAINAGIFRAHRDGIVTSASLMVRWPAAEAAVLAAGDHPALGVGLHLDLGEWRFGGWETGEWPPVYEVVALDDEAAVRAEVRAQLERFRALAGRDPTHLDSHQHVHVHEPVAGVATELAAELGVPVRHRAHGIRYCGDFYGQTREGDPLPEAIAPEALLAIIAALAPGVTELACHPGDGAPPGDVYAAQRRSEADALCDPRVRAAVEGTGVELRTFADAGHGMDTRPSADTP